MHRARLSTMPGSVAQGLMLVVAAALCFASAAAAASGSSSADTCTAETCNNNSSAAPSICTAARPPPLRTYVPAEPASPEAPQPARDFDYPAGLRLHVFVKAARNPDGDGVHRFRRSLLVNGLEATELSADADLGSEELKNAIHALQKDPTAVVLFIQESADALVLAESTELLRKFQDMKANVVFGAMDRCKWYCAREWPESPSLATYLDPYSFIGYASAVSSLLAFIPKYDAKVQALDIDYLHTVFLEARNRQTLGLAMDYNNQIFVNLYGKNTELGLEDDSTPMKMVFSYRGAPDTRVFLTQTGSYPSIIRGGGNSKLLSAVSRFAPLSWTPTDGCIACRETTRPCLEGASPEAHPTVHVYLRVTSTAPFLEHILEAVANQEYPRQRVRISVRIAPGPLQALYLEIATNWSQTEAAKEYQQVLISAGPPGNLATLEEEMARTIAAQSDYFFLLDSKAYLSNPQALAHLVMQDRKVVVPKLTEPEKYFSNFWGSIEGGYDSQCFDDHASCKAWAVLGECDQNAEWMKEYCKASCDVCVPAKKELHKASYKRSPDYLHIVDGDYRGVWDSTVVFSAVLMKAVVLPDLQKGMSGLAAQSPDQLALADLAPWELDMTMSQLLRQQGVALYVSNLVEYGVLVNLAGHNSKKKHPDLFLIQHNPQLWERKYVHPNWPKAKYMGWAQDSENASKLCWDIFQFPGFTTRFANDLIEEAEHFGQWSGGQYSDKRLKGGFEPVPTQDIHFSQFDFHDPWYWAMKRYIAPVAEHHWPGYHFRGKSCLDFIVRYSTCPTCQPSLRPHFDASTFSLNVALNQGGVDFTGGGTHFIPQNCTVLDNPIGHVLIHPGRLTHQHEGLEVRTGTRYILVTFVDQD